MAGRFLINSMLKMMMRLQASSTISLLMRTCKISIIVADPQRVAEADLTLMIAYREQALVSLTCKETKWWIIKAQDRWLMEDRMQKKLIIPSKYSKCRIKHLIKHIQMAITCWWMPSETFLNQRLTHEIFKCSQNISLYVVFNSLYFNTLNFVVS